MLTKQLIKDTYYDFDYDNQIIATEKYDIIITSQGKLELISMFIILP